MIEVKLFCLALSFLLGPLFILKIDGKSLVHPSVLNKPIAPKPPRVPRSLVNKTVYPLTCTTTNSNWQAQNISARSGITGHDYRWKQFNIWIDPAYEQWERDVISQAMWNLVAVLSPCVTFGTWPPNSTPTGDYVKIVKGDTNGCNSLVGRQGGAQVMNLQSPECLQVGTVTHEMIHALGFDHEHNRPDRDDYITVNWNNIDPQFKHAYEKKTGSQTYGVPYDYNSNALRGQSF